MGATVTRNGKTYYKGDDGKLYSDYNAARVAAEDRRNAGVLQGLQNFLIAPGPAYELSGPGLEASRARRARSQESALAGRVQNEPLTPVQLNALRDSQNAAIRAYQKPADGASAPPVLSDDVNARASEARRMLQQATPYWEREENQAIRAAAAEGGGPRAGEAGYAQRADIQAWMDAQRAKGPAGEAMVNRFIEQQKKRGLFEAPKPTPMVDQLAAPFDQREIAAMGYQGVKTEPQAMAGATAVQGVAPTADPRFEDPAYAAEVLRGAPVSPVSAIAGNEEQRAAAARGYSQAPAGEAFSAPVTLPNTAFVGNGMPQGVAMTPDRAQGVPGITDPLPTPEDTRDLNLNGEDALIRRYLSAIKGQ